jgi:glucose dehydrogenase
MSRTLLLLLALVCLSPPATAAPPDPRDWNQYNYDTLGTRHNAGEKTLSRHNVANLEEKWRFPARWSLQVVGVIHGTPVVVNGHVYFGTATIPTVYKLSPDGKLKWSYVPKNVRKGEAGQRRGFGLPQEGFINSPLVTEDTVYACDLGGYIYALNRSDGKERWKVDTRSPPFPKAHPSNCIFAAPVVINGKLIIAGGGFEHGVAAEPGNKGCTGRGFVAALDPKTGKALWKYDVGPEPGPLDPPVKIKDSYGEHVFHFGPSTSSVWSTPSYDPTTKSIYFGTDCHNSPRQPTKDDPRLYTKHSCAVIAVDAETGAERWVTQINKGDIWNYALRGYDPETGLYKDQSIGDTPKPYTITLDGKPRRVVGAGCKNGAFYVLDARTGELLKNTPLYTGAPAYPPKPAPHPRTLALPGVTGGLQTGIATDGTAIYTNGIDASRTATSANPRERVFPPTGGRVVSISLDTTKENWRHERPKVKAIGGTKEKPAFTDVGDAVGAGVALANGVAFFTTQVSNKLVALDTSSGKALKEVPLGPVWSGPSVSRGRVYVGTGNILFSPLDAREAFYPKSFTGTLYSFGLPGKDEVDAMGKGDE